HADAGEGVGGHGWDAVGGKRLILGDVVPDLIHLNPHSPGPRIHDKTDNPPCPMTFQTNSWCD
ncbi:MAG: hypothetical protein JWP79_3418, partial [Polaromonas sp.]|nr:hypothetical protein [Polaromonas sp.]